MIEALIRNRISHNYQYSIFLPTEYQQVEYLRSRGYAYIDTLVPDDQIKGCDVVFTVNNYYTNFYSTAGILGSNNYGDNNFKVWYHYAYPTARFYNTVSASQWEYPKVELGQKVRIEVKDWNNSFTNGTQCPSGNATRDSQGRYTIYLFNINNALMCRGDVSVFHCRIIDINDNTIRHFIPCYRKVDNVAGMYDVITRTFYTNAGTSQFEIGPCV